MDTFSGSCPQKFISFCLGMSSKKDLPESTTTSNNNSNEDSVRPNETTGAPDPPRPASQSSNCSRSTDESVTAFIERMVTTMDPPEPETTTDLPIKHGTEAQATITTFPFQKASVSEAISVTLGRPIGLTGQVDREETASQEEATPLYGDTTDVEELLDSSGVAAFPPIPRSVTLDSGDFPDLETGYQLEAGHSDEEQEAYRAKLESSDRQLSAKGRTIIRKYFASATPIRLPVGHPTVAFNQEQMHAILRTVADESALSSYHMMKSLLIHATTGASQDKRKKQLRRCPTPARHFAESSGDEGVQGGSTSDGYTSGAINTDEDPYLLGSISGTDVVSETDPLALTPTISSGARPSTSRGEKVAPTSGSEYSSADYQPLSILGRTRKAEATHPSPPRKRRKLLSKPGKVMKDAYFKGIQWTRTFVSGPVDPIHNKFKFYCMLCKTNVSIYSKGAREILRHYKKEGHLRKDQKWRYVHLQEVDSITGIATHQVRGKDGYVLTPLELEREKPHFIDVPLIDAGDRYPFYDDYMASIGGITNPSDLRTSTLISLIGTFVPQDGNLSLLQNLWTKVGVFTNHQALFSSFDWGSATLTVSSFIVQDYLLAY